MIDPAFEIKSRLDDFKSKLDSTSACTTKVYCYSERSIRMLIIDGETHYSFFFSRLFGNFISLSSELLKNNQMFSYSSKGVMTIDNLLLSDCSASLKELIILNLDLFIMAAQ